MKNNQYIEKYGEKALELYNRKSMRQSLYNLNEQLSDGEHQGENKKSKNKCIQRTYKSNSQKSLNRPSKSKSKINLTRNQNNYTFQKPLNLNNLYEKDRNLKKLIISGLSTPKNKPSRLPSANHQQRIPSSSTKKKNTDIRISQKLNDALYKTKSTKSIVKQLLQCLDMISQHQCKINKWLNQFKDIVYHIADRAAAYHKKYKEEVMKNKKMQKQMEEIQVNLKSSHGDKKRKPIQMAIMEQNQKLREKVQKLELKIQNFEKKQMILIQTLQKIKNPYNMNYQTNSTSKKQQHSSINNMKRDFYGNLDEDEQQADSQQQSQENQ